MAVVTDGARETRHGDTATKHRADKSSGQPAGGRDTAACEPRTVWPAGSEVDVA
ncbi:hypothetical protein Syun_029607 [Stephania yunnanensis]|uniref:Uncharacterized protein n=1 Tax=Stephania yunnanensis TaxID=152371 RepID=A0AAP0E8X3_9MAGN